MHDPLFTIVIPTKDRPALLRRALASALAQANTAFEIVVADDGDGTGAALASTFGDCRIVAFGTGGAGQVPARNRAVARARAPFIAFLDDDDWWAEPDHLARMRVALDGGAGLAYADGRIVQEDAGEVETGFTAYADAASLRHDNLLLVSGIAFDRGLCTLIGPFDETLAVYWDWDFYLRLAAAGVAFAPSGGTGVRISARGGTTSADDYKAVRQAELDRLCAKHGLTGIVLRNHESIARDQATGR